MEFAQESLQHRNCIFRTVWSIWLKQRYIDFFPFYRYTLKITSNHNFNFKTCPVLRSHTKPTKEVHWENLMLGIIISIVLCQARHTSANVNKKFGRVGKALLPTCTSAQISKCSNRTSILGSSIPTLKFEAAPFFQKQRNQPSIGIPGSWCPISQLNQTRPKRILVHCL